MAPGEFEKMCAGEPFSVHTPEIQSKLLATHRWLTRYNASLAVPPEVRRTMLLERLAEVGTGVDILPPFHCDCGFNIRLGAGAFLNFNCVILDVAPVSIGPGTQIGPGVQILTTDHPRDPRTRAQGVEFGRPIVIGARAWIGGGAIILPGVTIGDEAVVGAGSVVTHDVAAATTVMGNPARPR